MCKSKGLTKPEGEVKASLRRLIYGNIPSAREFSPALAELILQRYRISTLRRKLQAHVSHWSSDCVVSTVEHACYDPKDSELCLARAKPQETGVEARSRCDVQIHGISWA